MAKKRTHRRSHRRSARRSGRTIISRRNHCLGGLSGVSGAIPESAVIEQVGRVRARIDSGDCIAAAEETFVLAATMGVAGMDNSVPKAHIVEGQNTLKEFGRKCVINKKKGWF